MPIYARERVGSIWLVDPLARTLEAFVLEGARDTLLRCRPLVLIEQKPFSERYGVAQYDALEYLQSLGAVLVDRVVEDFLLGWSES